MTKKELILKVAENIGNAEQAVKAVDSAIEIIQSEVSAGNVVELKGFGKFKSVEVSERKGCDPRTREKITIPAHKKIVFAPSKNFKELVK